MQTYLTENVSVTLSFLSPLSRRSRRLSSSIPPNTLKFEMICFEGERWYTLYLEALKIAHMGLFIFSKGETGHNSWSLQSEGSGISKVTYLENRLLPKYQVLWGTIGV